MSSEDCPCISLDIGLTKDAQINNALREHNLKRHGFAELHADQLLGAMAYAMNPQARSSPYRQILIGCNSESISKVEVTNATAKSPLFSHLWQSSQAAVAKVDGISSSSPRTLIAGSQNAEELHTNLSMAIARKLSSLLSSDGLEQKVESPMTELGLDSLITTELKNWISTEFEAATQVSEILDQPSIKGFALFVASRSALAQGRLKELKKLSEEDKTDREDDLGLATDNIFVSKEVMPKTPVADVLTLPLPDLESTLNMYLESGKLFLSKEEYIHTSAAVQSFLQPGGFGQKLQNRLEARSKDPCIDNWLSEPFAQKIWLDRRRPLHPSGTFFFGQPLTDVPFTQVEKAASLAIAAFQFRRLVETGSVDVGGISGEPVCLQSLPWFFNAVREPGHKNNKMRRPPGTAI